MKLQSPYGRGLFFGISLFTVITVTRIISDKIISYKTFIPGLAGGLAGGLIIYFALRYFSKKRPGAEGRRKDMK